MLAPYTPPGSSATPSATRRMSSVALLGFASGLPLALSDSTLQAWLAVNKIDLQTIGWLSLVGLPYLGKFLWAPLLDRFQLPFLGRRRGWIGLTQIVLIALIAAMSLLEPARQLPLLVAAAFLLALVSATQDIAIDAYRAELLKPTERGLGSGIYVAGYRLAMLASGGGILFAADYFGFNQAYFACALLMLLGLAGVLLTPEPPPVPSAGVSWRETLIFPFTELLCRRRMALLLACICLYKIGDAFAGRLTMTFFLRELHFSLSEIGSIYKLLGIAASVLGGILGGALMYRMGLYRALLIFAALQAVTNLGFLVLAVLGKSMPGLIVVVGLENLSGGMGTSALVALIIALCDPRYTATQFALLSAIASLGRVLLGPVAGYVAEHSGWIHYFGWSFIIALPAFLLLWRLRADILMLDRSEPVSP